MVLNDRWQTTIILTRVRVQLKQPNGVDTHSLDQVAYGQADLTIEIISVRESLPRPQTYIKLASLTWGIRCFLSLFKILSYLSKIHHMKMSRVKNLSQLPIEVIIQ
jgi:hypothetical protein